MPVLVRKTAMAEQSLKSAADVDGRLTHAFRRVVCRPLAPRDLAALRRAYERQLAIYKADAASAKSLVSVGAAKRDESLEDRIQRFIEAWRKARRQRRAIRILFSRQHREIA